jgi:hypothetical protein
MAILWIPRESNSWRNGHDQAAIFLLQPRLFPIYVRLG